MAKFLRDLLNADEPAFSAMLKKLEQASGGFGADARLIGDITKKAHDAMRSLGLDPTDTTGIELYRALLARVEQDNARISGIIGIRNGDNIDNVVSLMVKSVSELGFDRSVFVLRRDKAKELLRLNPPLKLIENLGYPNIDELFAGEDFDELYAALRLAENSHWLKTYNALLRSVKPDDFEIRDLKIIAMNREKYAAITDSFVRKKLHNVAHSKEMGIIAVTPVDGSQSKGLVLKTLSQMLHYINEVTIYSSFFRLKAGGLGFGDIVSQTLADDPDKAVQLAGNNIHWRAIQRFYGKQCQDLQGAVSEPVYSLDMNWHQIEDYICKIDPEMELWRGNEYAAVLFDGSPVSFNLADVSLNYATGVQYEKSHTRYFCDSLWNEIYARYMKHPGLERQILQQLGDTKVTLDPLKRNEETI